MTDESHALVQPAYNAGCISAWLPSSLLLKDYLQCCGLENSLAEMRLDEAAQSTRLYVAVCSSAFTLAWMLQPAVLIEAPWWL